MADQEVSYIIRAIDATKAGLASAKAGLNNFVVGATTAGRQATTGFLSSLAGMRAGAAVLMRGLVGLFGGLPGVALVAVTAAAGMIGNLFRKAREEAKQAEQEAKERRDRITGMIKDTQKEIDDLRYPNGPGAQGRAKTAIQEAGDQSNPVLAQGRLRAEAEVLMEQEQLARKNFDEQKAKTQQREKDLGNTISRSPGEQPYEKQLLLEQRQREKEAEAEWLKTKAALKAVNAALYESQAAVDKKAKADEAAAAKARQAEADRIDRYFNDLRLQDDLTTIESQKAAEQQKTQEDQQKAREQQKEADQTDSYFTELNMQEDLARIQAQKDEDARAQAQQQQAREQRAFVANNAAGFFREAALDPKVRRQLNHAQQEQEREDRKYERILERAKWKTEMSEQPGNENRRRFRLTKREALALSAEQLKDTAEISLKNIAENTKKTLDMLEKNLQLK